MCDFCKNYDFGASSTSDQRRYEAYKQGGLTMNNMTIGAGYSFYTEHWIPLYKARGLKWHDKED